MKLSSEGMSLVEVLVTMGMLGGLAVAGMTLFKNQTKSQKTVEQNYEVMTDVEQIRGILSRPGNCRETFLGKSPSAGTVTAIKKDVNGTFEDSHVVGSTLTNGLKITSFELDNSSTSLGSDETNLKISYSRGLGTIKDNVLRFIKINYTSDASGILTCYSVTASGGLWKQSIVDPNDIYYNAGDVGVGLSDPQMLFSVGANGTPGGAFQVNADGDLHVNGGVDNRWALYSGTPYEERIISSPTGDMLLNPNAGLVGIGLGTNSPSALLSVGNGGVAGGAFQVNGDGDIHVSGGVDNRWGLYSGTPYEERMIALPSGDMLLNPSSGFVGIGLGTTAPGELFSVGPNGTPGGAFKISGDGDIIVNGGVDSRWGLFSGSPLQGRMVITATGNVLLASGAGSVGIGINSDPTVKLEVAGQVKIGGMGTCNASTEGSIAYDSVIKGIKFCDGLAWKGAGSGGVDPTNPACVWVSSCPSATDQQFNCPANFVLVGLSLIKAGWHGNESCWGTDDTDEPTRRLRCCPLN